MKLAAEATAVRWRERAGQGASSLVWLGESADGPCILKLAKGPAEARRFAEEAERLLFGQAPEFPELLGVGLAGPALAAELSVRIESGTPFLVLSSAPGVALDRRALELVEHVAERAALAALVARDIGAALAALHAAGAAHGDVKPANIIVDAEGARLVDFGLSAAAAQVRPTGGTRRYLAPEVFSGGAGDARARDLWALGVTLFELIAPDAQLSSLAAHSFAASELEPVIRALLAQAPGARPSASWVARRGLMLAPRAHRDATLGWQAAVRRSYLATRREEILRAARQHSPSIQLDGPARAWLEQSVLLAAGIARLRGFTPEGGGGSLSELRDQGRARFLVALVGPAAVSWPALSEFSEEALLKRLLELGAQSEPLSFTLAAIERGVAPVPVPAEVAPVDVALALRSVYPDPAWLDRGEALVGRARGPLTFALALARAFRLRGELGRALSLLAGFSELEARITSAELCRRARDSAGAQALLDALDERELSGDERERMAAIRARIALDSGDVTEAAARLAAFPRGIFSLETRALVELAQGDRQAALESASRARLHAGNDEERARAEAVIGLLSHAAGDAEPALIAFRSAADFAMRSGALLEEAIYLTGLSAAATNLGELGEALAAARRSQLLFEGLGRTEDAARALLATAQVYASAGAKLDARVAALEAVQCARSSGDQRCRGYAHLVLADCAEPGVDALEQAGRAFALLELEDDALRVAARLHEQGGDVDLVRFDASARREGVALDCRLEWWGARAARELAAPEPNRAEVPVAELGLLVSARCSLSVRGRGLHFGALLAARISDADATLRLSAAAADAAREFLRRIPLELATSARSLDWVRAAEVSFDSRITPAQIADVEALVRGLSQRDSLRPLLRQVVDSLVLWTGVERGLLLLCAPGGRLQPRAARNMRRADLGIEQLALSQSLAHRALELGEPVVAVDAAGDLPELHESVHALKLRSVLAVPLMARGEPLGVVYLDDRVRRGAFGVRELSWVRLVGTLAAIAISDAKNQLLLRRSVRRAERAEAKLVAQLAHREAELDVAERELARTRDARETRFSYDAIVGQSEAVRDLLKLVDRVTSADVPLLILGESGSGKELIARAVHENGPRKNRPFVSENCGAIPEGLLESALFGHVRGAFTGANRPRAGLFEVADHGTFFLDEIAEMSLGMQTKLLRVLQQGELRPVGSETSRVVDVRVIGATHRDLQSLVKAGKFREDLYYRLNVVSLRVPALRERLGDVPLLVRHFLQRYANGRSVTIAKSAMDALAAYSWPGNIRQLENEVRRALVLADELITLDLLSPEIEARGSSEPASADGLNLRGRVDALEGELVRSALLRTRGNQTRAAELLGLSRFGLQKMIKRLQIGP